MHLKSQSEIEKIRASCRIAAETMLRVLEEVKPGVTTVKLDQVAARYICSQGATASPLGYEVPGKPPFPKSICVSVNEVVVHGIPGNTVLQDGDILSVDITVARDGYHGDMNVTLIAGQARPETEHLLSVTRQALETGIQACTVGHRLGDVGHAIQTWVEGQGYSVVRDFCGHGIGREFHEAPQVLHFGTPGTGLRLQAGMVFTVEPMVNQGRYEVRELEDRWTAVTADGSLSAQFEHTLAVTASGPDVLSRFDDLPY